MGVRVSFDLGSPDGLEGFFWDSGPHLFRDWVIMADEEDPGFFSSELLPRLDRIVAEGASSLLPADQHDAAIIDEIFETFIGYYCDCNVAARSLLRDASSSLVNISWYREVQAKIESRCSQQTALCWRQLLNGRAVGRPPTPYPYSPHDEVFRLGYWTAEEVRIINDELRDCFPPVRQRGKVRLRDWFVRTASDDVAIKIVIEATTRAREVETGLITTVA